MPAKSENITKQLEKIGKRLRQLRKAQGYRNYEQFAYRHDINRSSYGRYEAGNDMRVSSLLKVLEALEVSLPEFFGEGFEEKKKKKAK